MLTFCIRRKWMGFSPSCLITKIRQRIFVGYGKVKLSSMLISNEPFHIYIILQKMYSHAFNLNDSWCKVNNIWKVSSKFSKQKNLKNSSCFMCGVIMLGKADSAHFKGEFSWIISNLIEITTYRWFITFLNNRLWNDNVPSNLYLTAMDVLLVDLRGS